MKIQYDLTPFSGSFLTMAFWVAYLPLLLSLFADAQNFFNPLLKPRKEPNPSALFQISSVCPDGYSPIRQSPCFKYMRTTGSWDEANEFCEGKYLLTFDNGSMKFADVQEYVSMTESFPGRVWTSMRVRNNRLVWDNVNRRPVGAYLRTEDNIYSNEPYPWELSPDSVRVKGEGACGLVELPFQQPSRKRSSESGINVILQSCTTRASALCSRDRVSVETAGNHSNVPGCNRNEYSNILTPYCFMLASNKSCRAKTCVKCPSGWSVYSPADPVGHLSVVNLSKMKGIYGVWLGVYRNASGEFTIANDLPFSTRKFPGRHVLKSFLRIRKELPQNFFVCLFQNKTSFQWTSCKANYHTVCVRNKTAVGTDDTCTKYPNITYGILNSESTVSFAEDLSNGKNQLNAKRYRYDMFKWSTANEKLSTISCRSNNTTGPLLMLRDGIRFDRLNFTRDSPYFATACYQCSDYDATGRRRVSTDHLCLSPSDSLRFVIEIDGDFRGFQGTFLSRIDMIKFNYVKEDIKSRKAILDDIRRRLFAFEIKKNSTVFLVHIEFLEPKKIDTRSTKYRLRFHVHMNLGRTKTASLYSIYTDWLKRNLTYSIRELNKEAERIDSLSTEGSGRSQTTYYLPMLDNLHIYNSDYCLTFNASIDKDHSVRIPDAAVRTTAKSRICPTTSRPIATASCVGDATVGARFVRLKTAKCESFTAVLSTLNKTAITSQNLKHVIKETHTLIRGHKKDLTKDEIKQFTTVLTKASRVGNMTSEEGKEFCGIYDDLVVKSAKYVPETDEDLDVTNALTKAMDNFTMTLNLGKDTTAKFKYDTFSVNVVDMESSKAAIVTGIRYSSGETRVSQFISGDAQVDQTDAAIFLPENVIKRRLQSLPGARLRLSFLIHYGRGFFPKSAERPDSGGVPRDLNTWVSALTVNDDINKYLSDGDLVTIVFKPLNDSYNSSDARCVFWDTNDKSWSDEGCIATLQNNHVVCKCNHLTNFAVLMSRKYDTGHNRALEIVSIVGLSLSIFALSLTILTFIIFAKSRKGHPQKLLFCLALTLLCSYIVFLGGITRTKPDGGCVFVGALLHYLLLSTFLWMLMEALLQYLNFVKVLGGYIEKFILKASIFCWGLPLVVVVILLAVNHKWYLGRQQEGYCWLGLTISYWAFLIPIGVILFINFVVFALVLWHISRRSSNLGDNSSRSDRKTAFYAAIACTLLLGLTWAFGYLTLIDHAQIVFAYIFTILNTLHGLFLFLFFTLRNKKVRQYWIQLICKRPASEQYSARSNITKTKPTLTTMSQGGIGKYGNEMDSIGNESSDSDGKTGSYDVSKAFMNQTFDDSKLD